MFEILKLNFKFKFEKQVKQAKYEIGKKKSANVNRKL